ncbi:MAG: sigma-54-dependent transcriptional regulator, partial [Bacillota bacterium]|nr:sigma-54-dependent transcriptional regulator [Bacillota bacterium]
MKNELAISMLQAVFLATQDAISVVNENGKHIMVNPAYTKITGIEMEDVVGKDALFDIEQGESLHLKVLQTKRPVENTKLKIKPSGKTVVAQAAPIIVDNILKGSVAVLHDVTGIKDLTEKLEIAEKKIRELTYKYKPEDIIGISDKLIEVKNQIKKAASVRATVLLKGESGTGKELFANSIHAQSLRNNKNFVRVNCAALTDSLLESELFGYEEGSFTGAKKGGKKGLFEEADGGTIFLDEISEISLSTQAKLLRVLQEKEIMR